MTTDEMIAVLSAYRKGRQVQVRIHEAWIDEPNPSWDFPHVNYRIKPKPHYRPFKNAEEVMEAIKEHGSFIRRKNSSALFNIVRINPKEIAVIGITIYGATESEGYKSYDESLDRYIFADGTPFGKLEE